MSATARRFAAGLAGGAVVVVFLNLLPFLRTRGAYNGDSFEIAGFPFTFRRLGGIDGRYEFHLLALIADIALGLVVAVLVGYACGKIPQRDSRKDHLV
jgi:hypothetical protein